LAQAFVGNKAVIRVFRALEWLSSVSGDKIMNSKPNIGKNFYTYKQKPGVNYTHILNGHHSPAA